MIPAAKWPILDAWLSRHAEKRIASAFARVEVSGLDALSSALAVGPVVCVSNHAAWWDALVILWLVRRVCRVDGYAMMDAKNLRRLPFFRRVGAFGVDLEDPRDGGRALRYAARLLDRPGRLVWIFPQGRLAPPTQRPLHFREGSAVLARLAPQAQVVPVALRYEHGEDERPVAYVGIGAVLREERDVSRRHEAAVVRLLDEIDVALVGANGFGVPFLVQRPSRVARFFEHWLGRLAGGLEPPPRANGEGTPAPAEATRRQGKQPSGEEKPVGE